MVAAASMGIPVVEVTPQQVKCATGWGGQCDKKPVVKMMARLLKRGDLNNHIADTAACAIAGSLMQ